jgi:hypothetical protein
VLRVNARLNLLYPLAPLFASLLSGCFASSSCDDFKGGTYTRTIELTPAEYEQWMMGVPPGDSPTSGASTSTGTGGNDSDVGGTAGGGSTGETGGGTAGDTTDATAAMMLTDQEICMMLCAAESGVGEVESCSIGAIDANGNIPVECVLPAFCEGRRHACVHSHGAAGPEDIATPGPYPSANPGASPYPAANPGPAATWLARAAHDEAASVHAFLALADELAAHGAPAELLARIAAAADDERRHAALVTDLALRHGASIITPIIAPTPTRDLLALAVENMAEGCVRETWAALSAAHQAKHAHTPELRDLYAGVAADETIHAELAWSIDAWLFEQLTAAEQTMLAAARSAAVRQLHASLAALPDEPELLALGVPDRRSALHLLAGLDAALWSQAA